MTLPMYGLYFKNIEGQKYPGLLFTDNIQLTVATERVRVGRKLKKKTAWVWEKLLRVWSLPDKVMETQQQQEADNVQAMGKHI